MFQATRTTGRKHVQFKPGFRIRIDLMRIRIQHFFKFRKRIPDPDPGFDDLKLKKCIAGNLISIFLIKNCNLLILGLHKGRPSYRRSLQPSKENIQYLKTKKIWTNLFLWVIFALLDPDPDPQFECGFGSGSSNSN